ncbi:MAG TPA: protoporphyrinogen IX oxidase [Cytophagales bacterium]|nr:protoporphyrinogen IX oxidase [Cytophagales bacterium]HAA18306.1 protoporphyrinogen IX oxidase [Cytophagales bacterium]HAP63875.1 protoporphyrinogen IX oxidase [Cytophagales bacterium]
MDYLYIKALHIIFVVTWFAGLFYIMRLYIYHREAQDRPSEEQDILIPQYRMMERRLWYIIGWPSAILTFIFGLSLIIEGGFYQNMPTWLWVKVGILLALYGYHFLVHRMFVRSRTQPFRATSSQLRMLNEIPTLFLISIVFLAVTKSAARMGTGMVILLGIMVAFMIIIRLYKRAREARQASSKA